MNGWNRSEDIEPPKDVPFWAYLYDQGIHLMEWCPREKSAEEEGGKPEDYRDCYVRVDDHSDAWEPRFWPLEM